VGTPDSAVRAGSRRAVPALVWLSSAMLMRIVVRSVCYGRGTDGAPPRAAPGK
jgi:hypothetical protein